MTTRRFLVRWVGTWGRVRTDYVHVTEPYTTADDIAEILMIKYDDFDHLIGSGGIEEIDPQVDLQQVCPFCRQPGPFGVYDDAVSAYAHETCSLPATTTQVEEARDFAATHPEQVER